MRTKRALTRTSLPSKLSVTQMRREKVATRTLPTTRKPGESKQKMRKRETQKRRKRFQKRTEPRRSS